MPGTRYTLSRDLPRPEAPAVKACRDCGVEKPNTFDHFPKVLHGARDKFRTADVCKLCKNAKISRGVSKSREWRAPSAAAPAPHDPLLALVAAHRGHFPTPPAAKPDPAEGVRELTVADATVKPLKHEDEPPPDTGQRPQSEASTGSGRVEPASPADRPAPRLRPVFEFEEPPEEAKPDDPLGWERIP